MMDTVRKKFFTVLPVSVTIWAVHFILGKSQKVANKTGNAHGSFHTVFTGTDKALPSFAVTLYTRFIHPAKRLFSN